MTKRMDILWVYPLYKKKIKLEAVQNDMTILEYTKKLAEQTEEDFNREKKKFKFNL